MPPPSPLPSVSTSRPEGRGLHPGQVARAGRMAPRQGFAGGAEARAGQPRPSKALLLHTGGFPLVTSPGLSAPSEASGGPLLAPPLLQRPAHPHGHHSRVAVIELHDERVALQRSGEAESGDPDLYFTTLTKACSPPGSYLFSP